MSAEGHFVVAARVRPKLPKESPAPCPMTLSLPSREVVHAQGELPYQFSHVLSERAQQREVHDKLSAPLLIPFFKGYNTSVLAYGQTGAGKTYSTFGAVDTDGNASGGPGAKSRSGGYDHRGMVPRFVEAVMQEKENREVQGNVVDLRVQFVEIYCERMYDLLRPSSRALDKGKGLPAQMGGRGLANASNLLVSSFDSFKSMLESALDRRANAITCGNSSSSRSHLLMVLNLFQKMPAEQLQCSATFADLAGSEDMNKAGLSAKEVNESRSINLSLFHLRTMIESLSKGQLKGASAQARSSKLTEALTPVMSGNCMVTVMLALSPCAYSDKESHRTLKFGSMASKVAVQAKPNKEVEKAIAAVQKDLEDIEQQERATASPGSTKDKKEERLVLQLQLGEATAHAKQRLQLERELQSKWVENVQDLWSVTETLRFGIPPSMKDRWQMIQHLVGKDIDEHERALDRGIRNADTVIIKAHKAVQKWLAAWQDMGAWIDPLGASHSAEAGPAGGGASSVTPPSRWSPEKLEALRDATKDLQVDLWECENKKDLIQTSYVRLGAALGALSVEVAKASGQVQSEFAKKSEEGFEMKRKDIEIAASTEMAQRVVLRGKQQLAVKQLTMEEKKQEVVEQLDSCLQVDLRGVFSRIQAAGSIGGGDAWGADRLGEIAPRLDSAETWQDMLPLVEDVLAIAVAGVQWRQANSSPGTDTGAAPSSASNAGTTTTPSKAGRTGKGLGEGGVRLLVELGDGMAAWVSEGKAARRLHLTPSALVGKGMDGAEQPVQGISLTPAQARHLCSAVTDIQRAVDTATSGHCDANFRFELQLDTQPRVSGGVASRKVHAAKLVVEPSLESRWAACIDIREWKALLGSRSFNKSKPPELQPIGCGVKLSDEQWAVLQNRFLDLVDALL